MMYYKRRYARSYRRRGTRKKSSKRPVKTSAYLRKAIKQTVNKVAETKNATAPQIYKQNAAHNGMWQASPFQVAPAIDPTFSGRIGRSIFVKNMTFTGQFVPTQNVKIMLRIFGFWARNTVAMPNNGTGSMYNIGVNPFEAQNFFDAISPKEISEGFQFAFDKKYQVVPLNVNTPNTKVFSFSIKLNKKISWSEDNTQYLTGKQFYIGFTCCTYDIPAQTGALGDFACTYRMTYTDM